MTSFKFSKASIALLFIFIFSNACTIQKRRYFKGFYVQHTHFSSHSKTQNPKAIAESSKKVILNDAGVSKQKSILVDSINSFQITTNQIKSINKLTNKDCKESVATNNNLKANLESEKQISAITISESKHQLKFKNEQSYSHPLKLKKPLSKRTLSIIIGCSLLLMAIVAGLTVPILSSLFVSGEPLVTGLRIVSNFSKYIKSIIGWIVILALDVLAALGVYNYYKSENNKLTKLTAGLRLLYSAILGVGIFNLLLVSEHSTAAAIFHHVTLFYKFWGIGLIVFGFHLIALSILFKNEGNKKWINTIIRALLFVAGVGYIIQYLGILFVANPIAFAAIVQPIFLIPMILGEVSYAVWKLVKGGKLNSRN